MSYQEDPMGSKHRKIPCTSHLATSSLQASLRPSSCSEDSNTRQAARDGSISRTSIDLVTSHISSCMHARTVAAVSLQKKKPLNHENVHQLVGPAPPHAVGVAVLIDLGVAALIGHNGGHVAADHLGGRRPGAELLAAAEAGDLEQRRVDLAHGVLADR
ncbi:hypothetical protein EJB05_43262, partial [Eragrostis curvula]